MSERLEEMLRIAQAATPGPWRVEKDTSLVWGACDPDDQSSNGMGYAIAPCYTLAASYAKGPTKYEGLANAQHIATFNPRTAEALVKVAMEQESILTMLQAQCLINGIPQELFDAATKKAREALSSLTAAMASEDGQSPAEGLSEAKPSEEDNSNVG